MSEIFLKSDYNLFVHNHDKESDRLDWLAKDLFDQASRSFGQYRLDLLSRAYKYEEQSKFHAAEGAYWQEAIDETARSVPSQKS